MTQVHAATRRVTATPASPEDFAGLLGFLEELEERRQGLDKAYDHVCLFLGHCAHISTHRQLYTCSVLWIIMHAIQKGYTAVSTQWHWQTPAWSLRRILV